MARDESASITLKILAQDLASGKLGAFVTKLDTVTKRGGIMGSVFQGVGQSFGQMLNPIGLATAGIGAVVNVMGDAVRMAAEEEAGIALLTQAISENDAAWNGNIDAVEELIRVRQDLAFSDDEQRESLRTLVSVTKDQSAAEGLLAQAMDLSRLKNISLASASALLGKVYAGNLGSLARMGIVLEEGATSTEALAEIQRRARGQAEKYAETTQGKLIRSQQALDNAMEDLGSTLTPVVGDIAELAARGIPLLAAAVGDALAPLGGLGDVLGDIGDEITRIEDETGIDFANHIANATRVLATGGFVLVVDAADDVQRGLQDVGEEAGILTEDAKGLNVQWYQMRDALGGVARAAGDADVDLEALDAAMAHLAGTSLKDVKSGFKETMAALRAAFQAPSSMPTLLKQRDKLQSALSRAIKLHDDEAASIASTALVQNQASIDAIVLIRATTTARGKDKKEVNATTTAVNKLHTATNKDFDVDIKVDDSQIAAAILRAQTLRDMLALPTISAHPAITGTGNKGNIKGKAHGGPVSSGQTYLVGERGPELLHMGGSGYVSPNASRGFSFTYAPMYSSASPAEAQRFAQDVTPALLREMARVGR